MGYAAMFAVLAMFGAGAGGAAVMAGDNGHGSSDDVQAQNRWTGPAGFGNCTGPTVGIVLLVALLVVYARTYSQTGARFALGLTVVPFALLLQSLLTSPLVYTALGTTASTLGPILLVADVFKVAALSVFLHLSLQ